MTIRRFLRAAACTLTLAMAPAAAFAQSGVTYLAIGSDPGEIPGGRSEDVYFEEQQADWSITPLGGLGNIVVRIQVSPKDGSPSWELDFWAPPSAALLGTFVTTGEPGSAAIRIYRPGGPGCGLVGSRFTVHEATPLAMAVDFEARCSNPKSVVYGQVRVHSSLSGTSVGPLEVSALSPVAPGTPVRFAATFSGGVPLQFRFVRYHVPTDTWDTVQDYSFKSAWWWTPTDEDLGDYYLQLWVRGRESTASYDEWRAVGPFTISVSPPAILSLTANVRFPVEAGTDITWTATASGGGMQLAYRFLTYSPAIGVWRIARDWSNDARWLQHASLIDAGLNTVCVEVRSGSVGAAQASEQTEFQIEPPHQSYALATTDLGGGILTARSSLFPSPPGVGYVRVALSERGLDIRAARGTQDFVGSSLYVALSDPDGRAPFVGRYDDARGTPDAATGVSRQWITFDFTDCAYPTQTSGRFRVLDAAYASDGTVIHFAADLERHCAGQTDTLFVAVRYNSSLPLFNMFPLTSNAPWTVGAGTTVTWTGDASSGAGFVEYKFVRYNEQQGTWSVVRDWDRNPQFTWTPTTADFGSYYLQVWARTVGSQVAYEDWRSYGPFVVAPVPPAVYGVSWQNHPRRGEPVTLEAVGGGGSGQLEYRFVAYDYATGQWSTIRDYAPSNRVDWTPPLGATAQYNIQVWMREIGSTALYDAWTEAQLTLDPARVLVIAGQPGDPVSEGRSVTMPQPVASAYGNRVALTATDSEGVWQALVAGGAATTSPLTPGVYEGATESGGFGVPTLSVRYSGTICPESNGRFTVHDIAEGTSGLIRAAIDFEQHCDGSTAGLYGGIRYNSNVPAVYASSVTATPGSGDVGSSLQILGVGSSMTRPVEYRFMALNQETGAWSLLREYGVASSTTWTPEAAGTYILQLWVRRVGSTAPYESYVNSAALTVYGSNVPLVNAATVTTSTTDTSVGSPVTVTGNGSSPRGPVEYRFVVLNQSTGQWSLLREYDAANTTTWTPTAAATYIVQLWVRRVGSSAPYETYANSAPVTVR